MKSAIAASTSPRSMRTAPPGPNGTFSSSSPHSSIAPRVASEPGSMPESGPNRPPSRLPSASKVGSATSTPLSRMHWAKSSAAC